MPIFLRNGVNIEYLDSSSSAYLLACLVVRKWPNPALGKFDIWPVMSRMTMQLTYVNKRNGHVLYFQHCSCGFCGWNPHTKNVSLWRDVIFVQDCGNVVKVVSKDFVVLQGLFRCHYFLDQRLVPKLKSKVTYATITWPFKVQRIFSPAKKRNLDMDSIGILWVLVNILTYLRDFQALWHLASDPS